MSNHRILPPARLEQRWGRISDPSAQHEVIGESQRGPHWPASGGGSELRPCAGDRAPRHQALQPAAGHSRGRLEGTFILSLALSPDGRVFATRSRFNKEGREGSFINLWDATTGEVLQSLKNPEEHNADAQGLAFSPDGLDPGLARRRRHDPSVASLRLRDGPTALPRPGPTPAPSLPLDEGRRDPGPRVGSPGAHRFGGNDRGVSAAEASLFLLDNDGPRISLPKLMMLNDERSDCSESFEYLCREAQIAHTCDALHKDRSAPH